MPTTTQPLDPKVPKTMTIPRSILERIDRLAMRERRSRSGQVTYLLELALARLEADSRPAADEG